MISRQCTSLTDSRHTLALSGSIALAIKSKALSHASLTLVGSAPSTTWYNLHWVANGTAKLSHWLLSCSPYIFEYHFASTIILSVRTLPSRPSIIKSGSQPFFRGGQN